MATQLTLARRRGLWPGIAMLISALLVLAVALCPPHRDGVAAGRIAVEHHLDGCDVAAHGQHVPELTTAAAVHQSEPAVTVFSTALAEPWAANAPCVPLPRPSGRALLVEISVARS
ncbi:hypothetical protein [Actinokineospora sp.]|uniref:hypothetical protein n=1 Tax=Actinokineospora sp. TaxID=1872133 RepID=UPI003D6BEB2E